MYRRSQLSTAETGGRQLDAQGSVVGRVAIIRNVQFGADSE
jgi:hypothetical protein